MRKILLILLILFASLTPSYADCDSDGGCPDEVNALLALEEAGAKKAKATNSNSAKSGISIEVDGETIVGSIIRQGNASLQGRLQEADIQIKFDGLDVTRRLSVSLAEPKSSIRFGERLAFRGVWNYPDWISRAEVRIYRHVEKYSGNAVAFPVEIVEMPVSGEMAGVTTWQAPTREEILDKNDRRLVYTLRVYDQHGRFDETAPLAIRLSDVADVEVAGAASVAPGEGLDRTQVSNIPLYGGSVTVYGRNVPPGYEAEVMNTAVPVDETGAFVVSRILPPGDHLVAVDVTGPSSEDGLQFERDIYIPDDEWFYVGLADLTIGRRFGTDSRLVHKTQPGEYSKSFERGRLAFYLKGKVKGETLITAALDTTEDELDVLLSNLDEKDPRQLLRRLDPDDYYPVYGDDSTAVQDAPTSGRFYVRIERGKSHVMWGNFKTRINGTELARFERGLYGGHATIRSTQLTQHGEPVTEIEAFGAQPGTLPQRDEFRGTGGSAYFLRRQDINQGSEQITIEERDRLTGLVVAQTVLRAGEDYDLDYVQGVLLLKRPLASTTRQSDATQDPGIGGNEQFVVAVYEYTPTLSDVTGSTFGGRASSWIDDRVRIGATGFRENTGVADQTLFGADLLLRFSDRSSFEFEWAQSEGDTFGLVRSTDGGFIFNPVTGTNVTGRSSDAWRGKLTLDLGEASGDAVEGKAGAYYEQRDAGFNAPSRYTPISERIWGAFVDAKLSEDLSGHVHYDEVSRADGTSFREVEAEVAVKRPDGWEIQVGTEYSDHKVSIGSTTGTGRRTEVGTRISKRIDDGFKAWVFGQATVDRSGSRRRNDRVGVGAEKDINDKLSVLGEVYYGTGGTGGEAGLTYHPNITDKYYLTYRLGADTTTGDFNGYDPFGDDFGSLVYGANRQINDRLSVYMEENYDFTGSQRSLVHAYGVTYTPEASWTLSGGFEAGEIYDRFNGDFDRVAISGTAAFKEDRRSAALRLEARFEDGIAATLRDRTTYLVNSSFSLMHDDNWRLIGKIDAVFSDSDQSAVLDGDYIEGSLGWAYRPVDDDRLNALFKYTYLYDLPGPNQLNAQNQALGPAQRSHVLSADFIYGLNKRLSIGAKYGFRIGEVSADRTVAGFTESSAHLAIVRADYHVVHNWDVLLEGRALWLNELDQVNYGVLAGVYRHIGDNLKLGIGYNFGQFSDDLTDLTHDDQGVFVNVVGKF